MNEDHIDIRTAAEILGVTVQAITYRIKNKSILPVGKFAGSYILSRKQVESLKREIIK